MQVIITYNQTNISMPNCINLTDVTGKEFIYMFGNLIDMKEEDIYNLEQQKRSYTDIMDYKLPEYIFTVKKVDI
jgi:hypothetical protein